MSQRTSVSHSKPLWGVSSVDAFKALLGAYKSIVADKGGQFKADPQTLRYISDVATFLTTPSQKRGIYLGGNCGNGKTTMLKAFAKVCKENDVRVLTTSAPRMVKWHLDEHNIQDIPWREGIICIDDLGTEPAEVLVYGNKVSVMTDFFEEAYRAKSFLFVTSNLGAKEIEERYGERVRDRFREMFHAIKFNSTSFR